MAVKKGGKGKKKKSSKAVVVLAVLAITLFLSGGVLAYGYDQQVKSYERMRTAVEVETIYPGVFVEGVLPGGRIDLGGLTYDQAMQTVMEADAQRLSAFAATVSVDGRDWNVNLPATSDAKEIVDAAYQVARDGELDERYEEVTRVSEEGYPLTVTYTCDTSGLRDLVDSIGGEIDTPMMNASVSEFDVESASFTFTDEQAGKALNREDLIEQLNTAVAGATFPIRVTGTLETVEPEATRAQLEAQFGLLATFSTTTTSDAARNTNIRLCSEAFNGAVVQPGETFSLNSMTGERTPAKGYQDAGAIKDGKLEPEPGGGVCQVSSTLFNAVVRSGLEIVERNNHSFPVSYLDRGHDAMIDYQSGRDFKFLNNSDAPVYLVSHFEDRELTMSVYGTAILEEGIAVELRANTDETIDPPADEITTDPTLPLGFEEEDRPARKGYRVTTYIQYKRGEELVREEELFKSVYSSYARRVRVGSMTNDAFFPQGTLPTIPAGDTGGGLPVISQ